eukprot:517021-Karenia_brevis.AAC.1
MHMYYTHDQEEEAHDSKQQGEHDHFWTTSDTTHGRHGTIDKSPDYKVQYDQASRLPQMCLPNPA